MRRTLRIALREYLENVRTKAFLIAVFMTPLLMAMSFAIPALSPATPVRRLVVADLTGDVGAALVERLSQHRRPPPETAALYAVEAADLGTADVRGRTRRLEELRGALDARVLSGDLFGYVVVRASALDRSRSSPPSEYRAANLFDTSVLEHVRAALTQITNERVVAAYSVDRAAADVLTARVPIEISPVASQPGGGAMAATFLPFAFTLLLFFTIVGVSQALITSTIEEKSNRVIEVLLSSVSPFELMTGKVLGTCAVGLTLMSLWAGGGLAALALQGVRGVAFGQLAVCLVYYLLGFLLIGSLMVAVGSACNTLKEAQNLLAPLMFLLTLPLLLWLAVGKDPSGDLARVLSFVPLFTPFLMMMRIASTPPPLPWEVASTILVLAVSAWCAMHLAGRVFRVGVLLYGKPASLREIFRWMRSAR